MTNPAPAPSDILEIFLRPGEFYFGDEKTRIRTLLGSCVAIVLWHPKLRIGGMCHYMLPHSPRDRQGEALDGRYAEDAMRMFMRELLHSGTKPSDYRVKLVGAGQMFDHGTKRKRHLDIAERNIEAGRELLERHGFRLQAHDLGGAGHRNVILDLWSGDVWLKRAVMRPLTLGLAAP
jgi:chemotaxis protein CheD